MPRSISPSFQTFLQGDCLTLAICVRVTRIDGVVMGFTSVNQDLVIDGVTYSSSNSVTGSAVHQEVGHAVDNLDVVGILQSDAVTETDIENGLYDGAAIEMFMCNWADLSMGTMILLSGVIGTITLKDGQYTAELRGLGQILTQNVCEVTSRTCRVQRLGDIRCQVNVAGTDPVTGQPYRMPVTLSQISSDGITLTFTGSNQATNYFQYGVCHFTSGAASGIEKEIKSHTLTGSQAVIELSEPYSITPGIGDAAWLEAGCDRLFGTCITKFNNTINFQGEPMVPGIDQVLGIGRQ